MTIGPWTTPQATSIKVATRPGFSIDSPTMSPPVIGAFYQKAATTNLNRSQSTDGQTFTGAAQPRPAADSSLLGTDAFRFDTRDFIVTQSGSGNCEVMVLQGSNITVNMSADQVYGPPCALMQDQKVYVFYPNSADGTLVMATLTYNQAWRFPSVSTPVVTIGGAAITCAAQSGAYAILRNGEMNLFYNKNNLTIGHLTLTPAGWNAEPDIDPGGSKILGTPCAVPCGTDLFVFYRSNINFLCYVEEKQGAWQAATPVWTETGSGALCSGDPLAKFILNSQIYVYFQTADGTLNYTSMPYYASELTIDILDVWGEGRVTDDGLVTGFTTALNINRWAKCVGQGDHASEPIPNLLPTKGYVGSDASFATASDCVTTIVTMGSPIEAGAATQMALAVSKTNGRVIFYDADNSALQAFRTAMAVECPGMTQNAAFSNASQLPAPFNEIILSNRTVTVFDYGNRGGPASG